MVDIRSRWCSLCCSRKFSGCVGEIGDAVGAANAVEYVAESYAMHRFKSGDAVAQNGCC